MHGLLAIYVCYEIPLCSEFNQWHFHTQHHSLASKSIEFRKFIDPLMIYFNVKGRHVISKNISCAIVLVRQYCWPHMNLLWIKVEHTGCAVLSCVYLIYTKNAAMGRESGLRSSYVAHTILYPPPQKKNNYVNLQLTKPNLSFQLIFRGFEPSSNYMYTWCMWAEKKIYMTCLKPERLQNGDHVEVSAHKHIYL